MNSISKAITRIKEERFPIRFIVSRILFRAGINLPLKLTFWPDPEIRTYLHASSAAHKLFIGRYHPQKEISIFTDYIEQGDVVVDVGANIGMYTTLFSSLVGAEGRVFAFEPTKKTFNFLEENLSLNDVSNALSVNAAVSDNDGVINFIENRYSQEQNHISTDKGQGTEVTTVRLDSFLNKHGVNTVDFIKIDVEGAEMMALKSLGSLLFRVKNLYLEFHSKNYGRFGYTKKDLVDYLQNNGFTAYMPVFENDKYTLEEISDAERTPDGNILVMKKYVYAG